MQAFGGWRDSRKDPLLLLLLLGLGSQPAAHTRTPPPPTVAPLLGSAEGGKKKKRFKRGKERDDVDRSFLEAQVCQLAPVGAVVLCSCASVRLARVVVDALGCSAAAAGPLVVRSVRILPAAARVSGYSITAKVRRWSGCRPRLTWHLILLTWYLFADLAFAC